MVKNKERQINTEKSGFFTIFEFYYFSFILCKEKSIIQLFHFFSTKNVYHFFLKKSIIYGNKESGVDTRKKLKCYALVFFFYHGFFVLLCFPKKLGKTPGLLCKNVKKPGMQEKRKFFLLNFFTFFHF